jgi:hypothetical protein
MNIMTIRMLNELIHELKDKKDEIYNLYGCEDGNSFNKNLDILIKIISLIRIDKRIERLDFDGSELSTNFKDQMLNIFGIFETEVQHDE